MATNKSETLDLLATLHYVLAGVTGLFSLLPLFHLVFGLLMLLSPELMEGATNEDGDPIEGQEIFMVQLMGGFFVAFSVVFMLGGFILAILTFIAGRKLKHRRSRTFCLVIASIECIFFPLGTGLGVFTLITLMDEEVPPMFET